MEEASGGGRDDRGANSPTFSSGVGIGGREDTTHRMAHNLYLEAGEVFTSGAAPARTLTLIRYRINNL